MSRNPVILFFPFIIEHLNFWGFSVDGIKSSGTTYLVQLGC
jgi:hypothetical protein